jgi:BlaI family penicillinase repressor
MEVCTAAAWPFTTTSPTVLDPGLAEALLGADFGAAGAGLGSCARAGEAVAAAIAMEMSRIRKAYFLFMIAALAASAGWAMIHAYFDRKYTCIFGKAMKTPAAKISGAESQIMEALWRAGPLSADGIVAEVGEAQGWAPGTVKTLITRLLRKKAIEGRKQAGGYFYRPLLERSNYVQAESQSLVDRLFGGEVAPLVAHFAEHRALTPRDIALLKSLIATLEDDE